MERSGAYFKPKGLRRVISMRLGGTASIFGGSSQVDLVEERADVGEWVRGIRVSTLRGSFDGFKW